MQEPGTGLELMCRLLVRASRNFIEYCRAKRAIEWFGITVAAELYMGAFAVLDDVHAMYSTMPWIISIPLWVISVAAINKYVPSNHRVAVANDKRPAAWLCIKAFLGMIAAIGTDVIRFTTDVHWRVSIGITSAVCLASFIVLPRAIRNVREDLVAEVLQT